METRALGSGGLWLPDGDRSSVSPRPSPEASGAIDF